MITNVQYIYMMISTFNKGASNTLITISQPSLRLLAILMVSTIILVVMSQKTKKFERAILATLWVFYMLIMLALTLPATNEANLELSFMERLAFSETMEFTAIFTDT